MKSVIVSGPGTNSWVDIECPEAGPKDVLLRMRACGVCGSDSLYTRVGGIPPRQGHTPLGHEPAAEVVEVGSQVAGVAVGDHVVVDSSALVDGLLGGGGAQGGLSEYIVIKDAQLGRQFRIVPPDLPWEVAALNEPMAVALHGINRSGAKAGDKAVVFGAGPIGLGVTIGLKERGVSHVTVLDLIPRRLEVALRVGADSVIDFGKEDVEARIIELQGEGKNALGGGGRAATDVWFDAAGAPEVILTALNLAKARTVLTVLGVHKKPVEINFQKILNSEIDIRMSMAYPTEIFEVTDSIIANVAKYGEIVSDLIPFERALHALELGGDPQATVKTVVVMD
ncbi:MAG: zinc-binding dehydrogenase [Bifidobacteriaceae bacterium]|jgi:threonine dehydrogenase-like Zn-dependent dehydrogenase|nr:zinc-binding dehydrogenase [Bifidobacteriaceae bacterium]